MVGTPRDPQLFALTTAAAKEAIFEVRKILSGEGHVLGYSEFPNLSWFDQGFPHLSTRRFSDVKQYRDAYRFRPGAQPSERVKLGELESFRVLEAYCLETPLIRRRFALGRDREKVHEQFIRISADLFAEHVMERFLHLHEHEDPSDELLLPIYLPLEAPVVAERLEFDILVPVVLTHFPDVDNDTLGEGVSLRKLSDDEHLARWPLGTLTTESVNELVLSAATHAFVFSGYDVSADDWANRWSNAVDNLPWGEIDLTFNALRVVTGVRTGYAQLVYEPKNWADEYVATLPPLIRGPLVRRYPEAFENWGWIKQRPSIERDQLSRVADARAVLSADPHLQLAARRFSESSLRRNEDDAVVDLCTCLEVLLTDDTKTEVVYKLKLRAAAVVADYWRGVDAEIVFTAVGVVYDLRSNLLHGSKSKNPRKASRKLDSLRRLKWGSDEQRTLDIARWIAQTVLLWTVRRGELVPATEIDRELVLAPLSRPPEEAATGET